MTIENAIKSIYCVPGHWVRVEQIRRIRRGLELCLGVYRGRRGKQADAWNISCVAIHQIKISDLDGGGLNMALRENS